jgi:hypothetical protein
MAIVAGDRVIPRSTVGAALADGGIPQPPLLGWVEIVGASLTVLWDDGVRAQNISAAPATVCEVNPAQAATRSTYLRKYVKLTASPESQGLVVTTLGVELDPDGASGVISECALVKTDAGYYFLAEVSDLTVVTDR